MSHMPPSPPEESGLPSQNQFQVDGSQNSSSTSSSPSQAGAQMAADPAPQAPQIDPQAFRRVFGNPVPALIAAGVSYLAGVLVAFLVLTLGVVALVIGGEAGYPLSNGVVRYIDSYAGSFGANSGDATGIFFLLGLPAQFVSMGFLGRYGISIHAGAQGFGEAGASAHLMFPVLLVMLAIIACA